MGGQMDKRVCVVLWFVCGWIDMALGQGSLTPSAAPAPTMKTLSQIEPRYMITNIPMTITKSGSYYLTTNIVYAGAGDGITIATNDVTIDLNGFSLTGPRNFSYTGIDYANSSVINITIRNGTIDRWGYGLRLWSYYHLQNLFVVSNYNAGADLYKNGVIENCSFIYNGDDGIHAYGPLAISRCTAERNASAGFYLIGGATIQNCSASLNQGEGLIATSGSIISDCSVYNNYTNGISVDNGCTVDRCSVFENYGVGILADESCSIKNCNASGNRMHGISAGSYNQVADNLCATNGPFDQTGAGIFVSGQGNRIENNTLSRNDYGLQITATSNFVARNTAYGNMVNYSIVAANSLAGIANVAGVSFTNTNPWTNFEY